MAANVYFKVGTRAQFDAIAEKHAGTLYWLTDTLELYRGDELFGTGAEATQSVRGLLSAADKKRLDDLVASGIMTLKPVDASVVIGIDEQDDAKTIGVQLSAVEANALTLAPDGLYAPDVEFEMEKMTDADEGYSATYRLKRTVGSASSYVGAAINIPKDLVVESGTVETVEYIDTPYAGAQEGDKYIDLVLANADSSHIYIPVNDLVDNYTAGDGITISNNMISVSNRTVQELRSVEGVSVMENTTAGGYMKYENADDSHSFIGLRSGGKNGITGELYSVVDTTGVGARLMMTNGGFYYTNGASSNQAYSASDEVATKGDIAAALAWDELDAV